MLFDKPLKEITEADILSLETQQVPEDKHLDYKAFLYEDSPRGKDAFRKDVTAFANASGGCIIFGIAEDGSKQPVIVGLQEFSKEAELQRLTDLLNSHIQPRIPGVDMHAVEVSDKGYVFIVRVPASSVGPHQILIKEGNFKDNYQFWIRKGTGAVRMDIDELRTAFLMSETQAERIRKFRTERLQKIKANQTFQQLEGDAKVILHLIPLNAFAPGMRYDLKPICQLDFHWGAEKRYNLDGLFTYDPRRKNGYVQVYRNGIIEGVKADLTYPVPNPIGYANRAPDEVLMRGWELIKAVTTCTEEMIQAQKTMGVSSQVLIMLSLVGVSKCCVEVYKPRAEYTAHFITEIVEVPEIVIQSFDTPVEQILKPVFDMVWNAAGREECLEI